MTLGKNALGLGLALALGLCGCDQLQELKGASAPAAPQARPAAAVRAAAVQPETVQMQFRFPGRVHAVTAAEVRPRVSGIVEERLFEEGAMVERGQVLFRLDDTTCRTALKQAEAGLAKAEAAAEGAAARAERADRLFKAKSISRQEYEDALNARRTTRAEVQAARMAVEQASTELRRTRIVAPVSGRIGRSLVAQGALVTREQAAPLAVIQQSDRVYVDMKQSGREHLRLRRAIAAGEADLRADGTARIWLELEDGSPYAPALPASVGGRTGYSALPSSADASGAPAPASPPVPSPSPIWGKLAFFDESIDPATGMVGLRAEFENPQGLLLPGMYVRGVLSGGERRGALLVPERCLQKDMKGRSFLWTLEDAGNGQFRAAQAFVETDGLHGGRVLLRSGIEPGTLVMTDGFQNVKPGALVRLMP